MGGNSITDRVTIQDGRDAAWTVAIAAMTPPLNNAKTAIKHDQDKLRFDLFPAEALEDIAAVYTFGAKKYDDWNWASGFTWGRILAAAMRHLWAFSRGEDNDPESGLSHVAHAAWNCISILYYQRYFQHLDDRHKRPSVQS